MVRAFAMLALFSALASVYHVCGVLGMLANDATSLMRHLVFVAIDVVGVWYFLKRPLVVFPLFLAIVVQQTVSHGTRAVRQWETLRQVDVISFVTLGALYVGLALLILEIGHKRH